MFPVGLINVASPLRVAILIGHADPSALTKVYRHPSHDSEFMAKVGRKTAGN
jgi:hypothetical protein